MPPRASDAMGRFPATVRSFRSISASISASAELFCRSSSSSVFLWGYATSVTFSDGPILAFSLTSSTALSKPPRSSTRPFCLASVPSHTRPWPNSSIFWKSRFRAALHKIPIEHVDLVFQFVALGLSQGAVHRIDVGEAPAGQIRLGQSDLFE